MPESIKTVQEYCVYCGVFKIHSLADEHSGAFQFGSVTKDASVNIFIRVHNFFSVNVMSGIAVHFCSVTYPS